MLVTTADELLLLKHELAFTSMHRHIQAMSERTKIITEQALALPREEQEALYQTLAESLGLPDSPIEEAWLDEAEARLEVYDHGEISSVTVEELVAARPRAESS
jgi:putative addiction module component (TIGR02574 family)